MVDTAVLLTLRDQLLKYSDDEARDEHGRWAAGGAPLSAADLTAGERDAILSHQRGFVVGERYERLDALFARQAELPPAIFYRGVTGKELELMTAAAQSGQPYVARGYLSVSANPDAAAVFGQPDQEVTGFGEDFMPVYREVPGAVARVEVSAGPRLPMDVLGRDLGSSEQLLPYGSRFSVSREGGELVMRQLPVSKRGATQRLVSGNRPNVVKYSEDEARDEQGRWTTTGGSAGEREFGANYKSAQKWAMARYPAFEESITPSELRSVDHYAQFQYQVINAIARGGPIPSEIDIRPLGIKKEVDAEEIRFAKLDVENLRSAFEHAPPLDKPMTVYRSFVVSQFGHVQAGDTLRDNGFVSTAMVSGSARMPAPPDGAEVGYAAIHLPAGTPVLQTCGYCMELVLPAGSTFQVNRAEGSNFELTWQGTGAAKAARGEWVPIPQRYHWSGGDLQVVGRRPSNKPTVVKYSDDEPRNEHGEWTAGLDAALEQWSHFATAMRKDLAKGSGETYDAGRVLVEAIANGEKAPKLYRGLNGSPGDLSRLASLQPGDTLETNVSSWSSHKSVGQTFAKSFGDSVLLQLEGAMGVKVGNRGGGFGGEAEWVTDGRFTVADREVVPSSYFGQKYETVVLTLRQEAVFRAPQQLAGLR